MGTVNSSGLNPSGPVPESLSYSERFCEGWNAITAFFWSFICESKKDEPTYWDFFNAFWTGVRRATVLSPSTGADGADGAKGGNGASGANSTAKPPENCNSVVPPATTGSPVQENNANPSASAIVADVTIKANKVAVEVQIVSTNSSVENIEALARSNEGVDATAVSSAIADAAEIANAAKDGVTAAVNNITASAATAEAAAEGDVADAEAEAGNVVAGAEAAVGNVVADAIDAAGNVVAGAEAAVGNVVDDAIDTAGNVVAGAEAAVGNVVADAIDTAGNVVAGAEAAADGVVSAAGAAIPKNKAAAAAKDAVEDDVAAVGAAIASNMAAAKSDVEDVAVAVVVGVAAAADNAATTSPDAAAVKSQKNRLEEEEILALDLDLDPEYNSMPDEIGPLIGEDPSNHRKTGYEVLGIDIIQTPSNGIAKNQARPPSTSDGGITKSNKKRNK